VRSDTVEYVVYLVGFAVLLWNGLYALTRGDGGRIAVLTAVTMLATCATFGLGGLLLALGDTALGFQRVVDRGQWWSAVLPPVLWLHLSLKLCPNPPEPRRQRQLLWPAYSSAGVLILLGTFTDLVRQYGDWHPEDVGGSLYWVFLVFVLLCCATALAQLTRGHLLIRPAGKEQPENLMLIVGSACFLLGGAYFTLLRLHGGSWSDLPAWLLLLAGLCGLSATIGVRSNLLLGIDVRRDFLYSSASLALLVAPYLLLSAAFIGFDDVRYRLLAFAVVTLIVLAHALHGRIGAWLDRAFFTVPVREERASVRAYMEALSTERVGPDLSLAAPKDFDDAVRRAIASISDPTKLATSPLLNLGLVTRALHERVLEDSRLNRAAVLKQLLLELLAGLKPAGTDAGPAGDACRYYDALYYPYVCGLSRGRAPSVLRQLQERRNREGTGVTEMERLASWILQTDDATFYRWQRRASDTIAVALREREAIVRGR